MPICATRNSHNLPRDGLYSPYMAGHLRQLLFKPSNLGSLGVEMEWLTVDPETGTQIPAAPALLEKIGPSMRIKPELFTSTIEINTDIHQQATACMDELAEHYHHVTSQLDGAAMLSSGTHPFSRWRDQQVSRDVRYDQLLERLQWVARRFNIFGIHVHVGMPDGDACIRAMNNLLPIMPAFLAISANSPFWQGDDTGLSSSRIKVFEGLSQGGMPFYFKDWQDFEHCAKRLLLTKSIDSVRDIWWEMRPHPDFGTLEVRIGDMPADKADTAAYIAYVRAECMVAATCESPYERVHPSLVRENRWRACRYGMQATIIDPQTESLQPLLEWIEQRLDYLAGHGAIGDELAIVQQQLPRWREHGDGASRQRARYSQNPGFASMIRQTREQDGWSEPNG